MDWAAPVRSHPSLLHHGLVPMGPGADPHGFPAAAPYPAAAAAHCQPRSHPTGMLGGCTGVQTFPKAATWSIPVPRHFSPPMVPFLGTPGMGAHSTAPEAPAAAGTAARPQGGGREPKFHPNPNPQGCPPPQHINAPSRAAVASVVPREWEQPQHQ